MKVFTTLKMSCLSALFLLMTTAVFAQQLAETPKGAEPTEATTLQMPEDFGDVRSIFLDTDMGTQWGSTTGVAWIPADNSFWISDWTTDTITRVDANGMFIERFSVPSSANRSITWDGTNVWFGNASTTIRAVNPTTRALVTSVTVPVAARFLTYDPDANAGAGGFWLGNWSTAITQVSMTGTTLATIPDNAAYASRYGAAYDNISPGGPYLWVYHQGGSAASPAVASQIHIASQTVVREMDFNAPFGTAITAGGLFITGASATSSPMLYGMLQNAALVGVDLLDSATITFEINTANILAAGGTVSADGIFLAGGTGFGLPGDNPATDVDGDSIWTVSVTRPFGFSSHYTFLNGNCPGWNCKENLQGLPCGDPNNFNDRLLPAVYSDTTILACFGACDSDGTCTPPVIPNMVTFNVNMDAAPSTLAFTTVYVSGTVNNWSGNGNPMTNNGDGTWTTTIAVPSTVDTIEWKFTTDDWANQEAFVGGEGCTLIDASGQFINRMAVISSNTTLPVYCWNACTTCLSGTNGLKVDETMFTLNPSLVSDFTNIRFNDNATNQERQIMVTNAVGQVMYSSTVNNTNNVRLETANYANGMYFVVVKTEGAMLTKRFVVNK